MDNECPGVRRRVTKNRIRGAIKILKQSPCRLPSVAMSECGPQVCRNGHGPTAGSGPNSQISKPEAQTAAVHEEDIDPFSYRPPLTRWNYVKVS